MKKLTFQTSNTGRPAPKFHIVAQEIERCIKNKEFVDILPGAHTLAKEFNVNFKTINKAIKSLAEKGVLLRSRGKATYITENSSRKKTKTVGILMRARGHVFGEMTENLTNILLKRKYTPVVIDISQHSSTEKYLKKQLDKALDMKPDMLIVEGISNFPYQQLKRLEKKLEKLIIIYSYDTNIDIKADYVLTDPWMCAYKAITYLIESGRKKILFVTPRGIIKPVYYRHTAECKTIQAYRMALEEYGLEKNEMIAYDNLYSLGLEKEGDFKKYLKRLFTGKNRPDAVFSYGDSRLKIVYDVISKTKLRIPDDVALIGSFNTPWCELYPVPLTSISIQPEEIVKLTMERLTDSSKETKKVFVDPDLIIRDSTPAMKAE